MKRHAGFSLTEVMLVIFIIGLILGAVLIVLTSGIVNYHIGNVQIDLEQELRKGVDSMVRELAQSGSSVVSVQTTTYANDTLVFKLPEDVDGNGTVLNATTGALEWSDGIKYYLSESQVLRQQLNSGGSAVGSPSVLANNISSLVFTGTPSSSPKIMNISLTASKATSEKRTINLSLNSSVKFRN